MTLSRKDLEQGYIQELARSSKSQIQVAPLSDEQLAASLAKMKASAPADGHIWVFGYGSLLWNPLFDFDQREAVMLHGYRRRFCLKTELGRGEPGNPGLILGLVPGGSCRGIAFRLASKNLDADLQMLWRREMVTSAYEPKWISLRPVDQSTKPIKALAFVMNLNYPNYVDNLSDEQSAQMIARACGPLGTCAQYLLSTQDSLQKAGIDDRYMTRLTDRVRQLQGDN